MGLLPEIAAGLALRAKRAMPIVIVMALHQRDRRRLSRAHRDDRRWRDADDETRIARLRELLAATLVRAREGETRQQIRSTQSMSIPPSLEIAPM